LSAIAAPHSAMPRWVALQHPGFARFVFARFGANVATQMQSVAVGWQVYDITRDPFDLGLVGLAQFAPVIALVLVSGAAADRFERRRVMATALAGEAVCALILLIFAATELTVVWPIFLLLVGFGATRAFLNPAQQAIIPNLVPVEHLGNAVAINSALLRLGAIAGPLAGGVLYGISPSAPYASAMVVFTLSFALTLTLPATQQLRTAGGQTLDTLLAGFRYIFREKIVLGAISLDLFAVLLGGVVALLPAYARDVLHVGPAGLGMLRAAIAAGGISAAVLIAFRPVGDRAGFILFATVALYGLAILAFGVSDILGLSLAALLVMGASDLVSVYIRTTLVQLWTPDSLRGRVSAVNAVSTNASNELGAFRAGAFAALFGLVPAVVIGGIGTLVITALWMRWFPSLRTVRRLDGRP
jgi:MFS family permease